MCVLIQGPKSKILPIGLWKPTGDEGVLNYWEVVLPFSNDIDPESMCFPVFHSHLIAIHYYNFEGDSSF